MAAILWLGNLLLYCIITGTVYVTVYAVQSTRAHIPPPSHPLPKPQLFWKRKRGRGRGGEASGGETE